MEAPIPLKVLESAPLKKALVPSVLEIFMKQSMVPVYITSALPDYIMSRLRTVSRGYETIPAPAVMT